MSRAITNPAMATPDLPMRTIGRTIRDFVLWSYERGTIQYDIMVTLILLFVFISPRVINFKDKPTEHVPQPTGVVVTPDSNGGFIYQIDGSAVSATGEPAIQAELHKIIEPISGEISILRYETVRDSSGRVTKYRVWIRR
ncbi:MAG: hypothetical protein ABSE92_05340 [Terriglobales bacterium]